eukprot:PhF_6_TR28345/c0_g1_i1/m.42027
MIVDRNRTFFPHFNDLLYAGSDFVSRVIKSIVAPATKEPAAPTKAALGQKDVYDPKVRAYHGEEGMLYRVPLPLYTPSEYTCRARTRNIQILLNNLHDLSTYDMLPQTQKEKEFWQEYPIMKTKLFFTPAFMTFPALYVMGKYIQLHLSPTFKGRAWPLFISLGIAEQYYDIAFPSHTLLVQMLESRTQLGDAARAEWQRLQHYQVSPREWFYYGSFRMLGWTYDGFGFGEKFVKL